MSLSDWANSGWLKPHEPTAQEIADLLTIVARDLHDAGAADISADWRFGIAYNAALKLCTILLHASGYRAERTLQHYRTIAAMPLILGKDHQGTATYLDACRKKRNVLEYDMAGAATSEDAEELLGFVGELRGEVLRWLRGNHPQLSPPSTGP